MVIKGYRVLIGTKPSNDLIEIITLNTINIEIAIIDFFGFHVLLKLLYEELTLLFEFLLLLAYIVTLDFLKVDDVDL